MNKQKPESKENVISFLLGYGRGSCSCSALLLLWLRLQFRRAEVLHKQRSQIK